MSTVMREWWKQPYKGGKMVALPGLPRPMFPPDAAERGKTPTANGAEVIAYKRAVARLGRWEWNPEGWDDAYSNEFAHGRSGGNVGESGLAGVQRQAKISPTGWIDEETFNLLRSVRIPQGLPHAGEPAIDSVARQLLLEAWESAQSSQVASPADVRVTTSPGDPHWGGSGDVMTQWIEPFLVARGIPLGSGKRTPAENDAAGGSENSDHLTTNRTTAARDFRTFSGEDAARALAESLGIDSWRPNDFTGHTFQAGGRRWRAQILWGAGIGHGDHIHVGISPV